MILASTALEIQKLVANNKVYNLKAVQTQFKIDHLKLKQEFIATLTDVEETPGEFKSMLQLLEQSSFFVDPASAKYHNAFYGGLLDHTMNVYKVLKAKAAFYPFLELSDRTLVLSALLHDLCKIGNYRVTTAWRKDSTNRWESYQGYGYNEDPFPLGHGEKSMAIALEHINLTREEALAIRWHSGPFEEGKNIDFTRAALACGLVGLLHTADFEASTLLESQGTIEWLISL